MFAIVAPIDVARYNRLLQFVSSSPFESFSSRIHFENEAAKGPEVHGSGLDFVFDAFGADVFKPLIDIRQCKVFLWIENIQICIVEE